MSTTTSPREWEAVEGGLATRQVVADEVASFLRAQHNKQRLMPRAALIGLLAGLLGVAFRVALASAESFRDHWVASHGGAAGMAVTAVVVLAGCWIGVAMVREFAPETAGSGIPHLKAVVYGLRSLSWQRVIPVKFIGGIVSIGAGMALGREGPTTQMGGGAGALVSDLLSSSPAERQTLILAGAGAGLAAAFNAPMAGTAFVLEELQRDFTPDVFIATLVATVVATIVTRALSGQAPVISVLEFPTPPLEATVFFALLGVMAGLLGVAYNRGLLLSLKVLGRLQNRGTWLVGVVTALCVVLVPGMVGGARPVLDRTLTHTVPWMVLVGIWMLRYVLTLLCYGSGAPGGIFAPLLVLGALNGLLVGQWAEVLHPMGVTPAVYAVVGMGAYFSAIVRAPLTGILLIVEMTSNFNLTLPLLVASVIAYLVAEAIKDRPIYEALLELDLARTEETPTLSAPYELEFTVQHGSEFEDKAVSELGLGEGCVLVTIHRGMRDIMPGGNTRLKAGDRVRAVVAAEAPQLVYRLKKGAGLV